MKVHEVIECLQDKVECKYCKYASENCRQKAIQIAWQYMQGVSEFEKDLAIQMINNKNDPEKLSWNVGLSQAYYTLDKYLQKVQYD